MDSHTVLLVREDVKGLQVAVGRGGHLVSRPPGGGSFSLNLIDPLNCVETVLARFTAVRLDGCRKEDFIRNVWPRAADSGGFALGALGDITPTS